MKISIPRLLALLFLFNNCAISQENHSTIESNALIFVKDSLIDENKLLEFNNGFLVEYDVNLKGLLDNDVKFYSSGKTCQLSTVGRIEEDKRNNSQDIYVIRGFNYDRQDKEKLDKSIVSYNLPDGVERMKLKEFQKLKDQDSFFITVLHHLEFNNNYLVEVNIAKLEELPNLSQFTFYLRMNTKLEVIKWDFIEGYDPEFSDGCG